MNKVILLGRLTKDPEVRYTDSGKAVCRFTLAVQRPFKTEGGEDADFFPVILWDKNAETCGNSVSKGQRLLVEGRLQVRSFDYKGEKKYVTEVVASRFEYIERKSDNNGNNDSNGGKDKPFSGKNYYVDDTIPF